MTRRLDFTMCAEREPRLWLLGFQPLHNGAQAEFCQKKAFASKEAQLRRLVGPERRAALYEEAGLFEGEPDDPKERAAFRSYIMHEDIPLWLTDEQLALETTEAFIACRENLFAGAPKCAPNCSCKGRG
jgi:hypothetical protein